MNRIEGGVNAQLRSMLWAQGLSPERRLKRSIGKAICTHQDRFLFLVYIKIGCLQMNRLLLSTNGYLIIAK